MYEKLDKLREEVGRCERRFADAQNKLKAAQEKLREAETSQILSDVGALKLTPEQLAQVLSLVKSGQFGQDPGAGAALTGEAQTLSDSATAEDSGISAEQGNAGGSSWRDAADDEALALDEDEAYART
jgi:hypothetical protein